MPFALFKRRAVWLPTWPVCLVAFVVFVLLVVWIFSGLHRFLAVTEPAQNAEIMVVEAWMTDAHTEEIAKMFTAPDSTYREVWLTGPELTHGSILANDDRDSFAELTGETLLALGVPSGKIHIVTAADTQRHRTWNAANQFKEDLLSKTGKTPERFDLLTVGTHARRSRLVFEKVFGDGVEIGVVALDPVAYDGAKWYKSSAGMKGTLLELVAYVYEKIGNSGR